MVSIKENKKEKAENKMQVNCPQAPVNIEYFCNFDHVGGGVSILFQSEEESQIHSNH